MSDAAAPDSRSDADALFRSAWESMSPAVRAPLEEEARERLGLSDDADLVGALIADAGSRFSTEQTI